MLFEIIVTILSIIGAVTLALILASIMDDIKDKIKEVMNRQSKIRCLCKHKFVSVYEFEGYDYIDFDTKCKKCGKEKNFRIYKKGVKI